MYDFGRVTPDYAVSNRMVSAIRLLRDPVRLLSREEWKAVMAQLDLAGRAAEILQACFAGATEKDIADDMSISVHTVHEHVKRLYKRIGLTDRRELILLVFAIHLNRRPARGQARAAVRKKPTGRKIATSRTTRSRSRR